MKLLLAPDREDSPKKNLILELTVLFVSYQLEKVQEYLCDDVKWTLVGHRPIERKERFLAALAEMSDIKATELTIHQILIDGVEGAIHGEMLMEDGKRYGFADFYEFDGTKSEKVKAIVSYVISK